MEAPTSTSAEKRVDQNARPSAIITVTTSTTTATTTTATTTAALHLCGMDAEHGWASQEAQQLLHHGPASGVRAGPLHDHRKAAYSP